MSCDCPPGPPCEVCRKLAEVIETVSSHPEIEITLMHADDGTSCVSTVRNDAGTLRCTGHGRAVYGSGWFEDHLRALTGCLCHEGDCLCVVQCRAPGCCGVRHAPDGTALDADGKPVRLASPPLLSLSLPRHPDPSRPRRIAPPPPSTPAPASAACAAPSKEISEEKDHDR